MGKRFKIAHLQPAKGVELNRQLFCEVVGFERDTVEARLHCRIGGSNEPVRQKQSNLIPEDANAVLGNLYGKFGSDARWQTCCIPESSHRKAQQSNGSKSVCNK